MSKPAPLDKESVTKLGAEINYYLNHQYTLYLSGVTLVGAVMAWVSQLVSPVDPDSMNVAYLAFSGLSFFMIMLAILEARLEIAIAICGTFLRLSGQSAWERQIQRFRETTKNRIGITTRGAYYVALGSLVFSWPLILSAVIFDSITMSVYVLTHALISILYFLTVFFLIPWGTRLRVAEIENAWMKVLSTD